jgi:hypothetical protein
VGGQMNLLAAPVGQAIEVPICPAVLYVGANARAEGGRGEPLFAHRFVPPAPPAIAEQAAHWPAVLEFAEDQLRYAQAPRARLVLSGPECRTSRCTGGACGTGRPSLSASPRGVEADGRLLTWARVLAGRSEQRDAEPQIARARDLAHAYHLLDYYGRAYVEPSEGEEWSPVPLIAGLAERAYELGGDPSRLEPRTEYMREGIEMAESGSASA